MLSSVLLLLVYRQLQRVLGEELFGLWALTMAVFSSAKLLELGLGITVTKLTAEYDLINENRLISKVINSALLLQFMILAVVMIPLYYFMIYVLHYALPVIYYDLINDLTIVSLMILVGSSFTSIFIGVLEGFKRMDLKLLVIILPQLLFLFLLTISDSNMGILEVLNLYLIQILFFVILSLLTAFIISKHNVFHSVFSSNEFKKMFFFGGTIQLSGLLALALDPLTKIIISRSTGLINVGLFELFIQIIGKGRLIVVSANQALIPYFSKLNVNNKKSELKELLIRNVNFLLSIVTLMSSVLIILGPFLYSFVSNGEIMSLDNYYLFILISISWLFNILATPWYYMNIGTSKVNLNLRSHLLTAIINLIGMFVIFYFEYNDLHLIIYFYCFSIFIGTLYLIKFSLFKLLNNYFYLLLIISILCSFFIGLSTLSLFIKSTLLLIISIPLIYRVLSKIKI